MATSSDIDIDSLLSKIPVISSLGSSVGSGLLRARDALPVEEAAALTSYVSFSVRALSTLVTNS